MLPDVNNLLHYYPRDTDKFSVRLSGWCDSNSQDLKGFQITKSSCDKAKSKLWILHRMKILELNQFQLVNVYIKEIRSILETAFPVWHPGLTKLQSREIENVQKISFTFILSEC